MQRQQVQNDVTILNYIRRYGPVSKALVARQTGITPPTVTNICNTLIAQGLVYEDQQAKPALGRPSMLLKFNSLVESLLIIHIRTHRVIFYITDAASTVLEQRETPIIGLTADEIMQVIYQGAADCIENGKYRIRSIGMVMRGPVDSSKGISVFSPHAGWSNIPFKYILEERFHLPVYIENDVRSLTIGEYYFGAGKEADNLLVVKFSYGVGAALMHDGSLYRGYSDGAGEMGHMILGTADGAFQTLEDVASETAVRNYVVDAIKAGRSSQVENQEEVFSPAFSAEPIFQAAVAGDKVSLEAIDRVGRYLGISLANVTNLINPQRIVVSSVLGRAVGLMDPIIRRGIEEYSYKTRPVDLVYSGNGAYYTLRGIVDIISSRRASEVWRIS